MKCTKCGKENIQIVSHYIEYDEKETPAVLKFLLGFAIFLMGFSIIIFFVAGKITILNIAGLDITGMPFGVFLAFLAIPCFLLHGLIYSLLPYKHKTELKAVCLDCGNTWNIETSTNLPKDD